MRKLMGKIIVPQTEFTAKKLISQEIRNIVHSF